MKKELYDRWIKVQARHEKAERAYEAATAAKEGLEEEVREKCDHQFPNGETAEKDLGHWSMCSICGVLI